MKKKAIILLLLLVGAVSYCAHSTHIQSIPLSDAECLKQFRAHRNDFERLLEMLKQDKPVSEINEHGIVPADRTSPFAKTPEELGFPRKRYEEYLALFSNAGLKSVVSADDKREFFFPLFHSPGGALGQNLGIAVVWREDAPENQIASSDEYWSKPSGGKWAYRHIEGKWYLLMTAP